MPGRSTYYSSTVTYYSLTVIIIIPIDFSENESLKKCVRQCLQKEKAIFCYYIVALQMHKTSQWLVLAQTSSGFGHVVFALTTPLYVKPRLFK